MQVFGRLRGAHTQETIGRLEGRQETIGRFEGGEMRLPASSTGMEWCWPEVRLRRQQQEESKVKGIGLAPERGQWGVKGLFWAGELQRDPQRE